MSFLRHVGKIGDRKVAIVFREVPNESHMALVVYTELLNRHVHDPLMKCIESDIGQNSENLADALNRTHTNDGKIILQVLHKEGMLKKVQTNQVVMTPNPSTQIKLDELNKILDEMAQGEEAVKRLAEIDQSRGIQSPNQVAKRMKNNKEALRNETIVSGSSDVLGDSALANNLRNQAERMAAEAKGLLAESARLMKEANQMMGINPETVATTAPAVKKRGRPAKVVATV